MAKGRKAGALVGLTLLLGAVTLFIVFAMRGKTPAPKPVEVQPQATEPVVAEPQPEPPAKKPKARKKPAPAVAQEKPEVAVEPLAEDVEAGRLVSEAAQNLRPITWERYRFSDQPRYMSPEDADKARAILEKYSANFAAISSFKCRDKQTLVALSDDEEVQYYMNVRGIADNRTTDIEITRSPVYAKMLMVFRDGQRQEAVVTPGGKVTNVRFEAESFIPTYIDGDYANVDQLVEYGRGVKSDVTMDYELPGLEDYIAAARKKNTRYDVITQDRDEVWRSQYYFNRDTGMIEFGVTSLIKPEPGQNPLLTAQAYSYRNVGGIWYPSNCRFMAQSFKVQADRQVTDLVINGVPMDKPEDDAGGHASGE